MSFTIIAHFYQEESVFPNLKTTSLASVFSSSQHPGASVSEQKIGSLVITSMSYSSPQAFWSREVRVGKQKIFGWWSFGIKQDMKGFAWGCCTTWGNNLRKTHRVLLFLWNVRYHRFIVGYSRYCAGCLQILHPPPQKRFCWDSLFIYFLMDNRGIINFQLTCTFPIFPRVMLRQPTHDPSDTSQNNTENIILGTQQLPCVIKGFEQVLLEIGKGGFPLPCLFTGTFLISGRNFQKSSFVIATYPIEGIAWKSQVGRSLSQNRLRCGLPHELGFEGWGGEVPKKVTGWYPNAQTPGRKTHEIPRFGS